jgi:hypothetical protein
MKNYYILLICVLLTGCQQLLNKGYKYRVISKHGGREYMYYTDTLECNGDTIGYHNSDSSYVLISYKKGLDCKIDTYKNE